MTPNEYSDPEFIKLREKVQLLEIGMARLQEQEIAADRALVIANQALQHSQAVSNEWRKENIDQRSLYPTSARVEGMLSTESSERRSLEKRLIVMENLQSSDIGSHAGKTAVWGVVLVIAIALINVLMHFWR